MNPLVTISLVHFSLKDGYSIKHHLQPFFESLFAQTYKNVEIFCVDNASTDEEAMEFLRNLQGVTVIWEKTNRGTCVHNEVFKRAKGKYLWCVTMDTRYEPDFLEKLVEAAEKRPTGGAFGGALLFLDQENKTERVDTLGTAINIWNSFAERHHKEIYAQKSFPEVEEIFGISGATVLYRTEALQDIALSNGDVFDERFFMYYEDVDVAYRLQWRGWGSFMVHGARGWHVRTVSERVVRGGRVIRILRSRKNKSSLNRSLSTRNKMWLLWRNLRPAFSWRVRLATALEVLGRVAYILVFERALVASLNEAWRQRSTLERLPAKPDEKTAARRIEALMS